MSRTKVRISEPPRRPPIELEVHPPKKLSPQEVHSSSYRLSRVPKKFNSNKAIESEKSDSYINNYFHNHPEEIDKSTPNEKREKINQILQQEDIPIEDRLHNLIKLKALDQIKYGENSPECFSNILQIGVTYNRLNRQTSGIRNLNRCKEIKSQCDIDPHEEEEMYIELAEAHLVLSANQYKDKKSEASKHIRAAISSISPISQKQMEDPFFIFRRDAVLARISNAQGNHKEAIDQYNTAIQSYQTAYGTDCTPDKGYFLEEIAINAEAAGNDKKSIQMKFFYYQKAYEVYTELSMDEEAERVYPKLAREGDLDSSHEEEEEENLNKEENEGPHEDIYMTETDSKARIEDTPGYKERAMEKIEDHEQSDNTKKDSSNDSNDNDDQINENDDKINDNDDHGEEESSKPVKSEQSENENQAMQENEHDEEETEAVNVQSVPADLSNSIKENYDNEEESTHSTKSNQHNDEEPHQDDDDDFEDEENQQPNVPEHSESDHEDKEADDDFEE